MERHCTESGICGDRIKTEDAEKNEQIEVWIKKQKSENISWKNIKKESIEKEKRRKLEEERQEEEDKIILEKIHQEKDIKKKIIAKQNNGQDIRFFFQK
jgi:hypothetical protein